MFRNVVAGLGVSFVLGFAIPAAAVSSESAAPLVSPGRLPDPPAGHTEVQNIFDVAVAAVEQRWVTSLGFAAHYGFGGSQKFRMGFGVRYSTFWAGRSIPFSTADYALADSNQVSTLQMSNTQTHSINAVLHVRYDVHPGWQLGMNFDLIGFGFGPPQVGQYTSSDPALSGPQQARASAFNLFLGGSRNRGQLLSEFYFAHWPSAQWGLRVGYSAFVSEVRTDVPRDFGSSRYRAWSDLFFVGASYRL